ncbi:toxin RelG [Nocardioides baekrokdamisoli]|uniref:Toxin RelG n=1 Tax=Nocardioides baekrokdamisoli TaxID=1804624 RepID=A0A3G9II70_9ACTN|nr:type II toxin-antitoxin system RelE/ParE family toxin [Nocardioides baekrokdamisoli]BBH15715.1 toxin RelG [Nocardioides baekrokdamisoli]
MTHRVLVSAPAQRSLAKLPPRIAEPLVAFIFGSLADAPRRRGKPLQDDFAGLWSARRGDYRVIYRIHEQDVVLLVVKLAHRAEAHRPL